MRPPAVRWSTRTVASSSPPWRTVNGASEGPVAVSGHWAKTACSPASATVKLQVAVRLPSPRSVRRYPEPTKPAGVPEPLQLPTVENAGSASSTCWAAGVTCTVTRAGVGSVRPVESVAARETTKVPGTGNTTGPGTASVDGGTPESASSKSQDQVSGRLPSPSCPEPANDTLSPAAITTAAWGASIVESGAKLKRRRPASAGSAGKTTHRSVRASSQGPGFAADMGENTFVRIQTVRA